MRVLLFLSIFSLFWVRLNAARILVTYGHDEKSHLYSMMPLLNRLAESNHSILVFETGSGAKKIDLGESFETVFCQVPPDGHLFAPHRWVTPNSGINVALRNEILDKEVSYMLKTCAKEFQYVMNADIDLVIVDEIFTIHGMLIADKLYKGKGTPYVIFGTSHLMPDWHSFTLALGHNPVLNPLHGSYIPTNTGEFFDPSSFTHRLRNVMDSVREVSRQEYVFNIHRSPENFGHDSFCAHNFMKTASLYLREGLDRHRVIPISTDWRPAGAHCSKKSPPALAGELKEFVESPNSNGTIYIAFGTIIDFGSCPETIFNAFFETLNALSDYRIVMSMRTMRNRTLPHLKNHVKVVPWAPQPSILTHNKTKLFLTHGGLKSLKEALCTETPVLVMPIFAEQGISATLALQYGFGRALNKLMFSKEDFLRETREILQNGSYQEKISRHKTLQLDRIIPNLNEATFFVERIIRRKAKSGSHFVNFRRKGMKMSWITYFYLDLIVFGFVLVGFLS